MKNLKTYASVLTLAVAAIGTAAQATDLIYGSYLSPEHGNNKFGMERFMEEAKTVSEGSLSFQFIPGGALVGAKTTLEGIRDGIVDGGIVVSLYHASDLPYNSVITNLTAFGGDAAVVAGATNETTLLNCPQCMEEWANWNVKHLGAYSTSMYKLLCAKEVTSIEDIKGWRIRAAGATGRWINHLGATPVNIPATDTYEALQRGQVECTVGSLSWLKTFSLGDVANSVYDLPSGAYFGGSIANINTNRWDSLSDIEKKAIIAAAPKAVSGATGMGYIGDDVEYAETGAAADGITINTPSEEEMAMVDEYRKTEADLIIKMAQDAGIEGAEEIVNAFLANLEKWEGIIAEIGHDPAKYEEALQREIYSKLDM